MGEEGRGEERRGERGRLRVSAERERLAGREPVERDRAEEDSNAWCCSRSSFLLVELALSWSRITRLASLMGLSCGCQVGVECLRECEDGDCAEGL